MNAELDWTLSIGLPARWRGLDRFVVLEANRAAGGHLATIDAWRRVWQADADRCAELHVIVVDAHAPALTPNIHRLSFDDGAFVALVLPMPLDVALAELVAHVDLFHVDTPRGSGGSIDRRAWKAFARLAADDALLVLESAEAAVDRIDAKADADADVVAHADAYAPGDADADAALRAALVTAGFRFQQPVTGPRAVATFKPRDTRQRQRAPNVRSLHRSSRPATSDRPRAIIIGAGLAGCATAWALAERGWRSTIVDAHERIAAEASGNPAGLFHGIFNRHDGRHARFNRAASLEAAKAVRIAIDAHGAHGAVDGVIRIETGEADVATMRASIAALGLPPDYIEALDASGVSEAAGFAVGHAGWLYRRGGWVDPAALARSFIERSCGLAEWRPGQSVTRLRRVGTTWQLLDASNTVNDEATTVVLANAHDAMRLLNGIGNGPPVGPLFDWPLTRVRGQVSVMRAGEWLRSRQQHLPRLPLTGSGYVIALDGGRLMFGATAQPDDDDASVRVADHVDNLARLDTWLEGARDVDPLTLEGRTAWRCVAADRMPVIGAVPLLSLGSEQGGREITNRLDQPRFVPREPGLFVHTALGSRGITWAALGAETLAAIITGVPCPLEASLIDAIDPARFLSRLARRGG